MSTSTPDTLDADRGLRDVLHRVWGFSDFRPLQREAMIGILAARDSVVVLPTGGGKSVCFQAPALVDRPVSATDATPRPRHGLAVVISPLISLMKDQVDGLRVDGVAAAYLNSTLPPAERDAVTASIRDDRCRLLYVSPERILADGGLRRMLQQARVRFLAIDEAHCISQWGHDFRPEYRQLGALRDEFPDVSVHAFTATATGRVRQDIIAELRLRQPEVLVGSFDRPNLTYRVLRRATLQRQLLQILTRHAGEAGIVYCGSRREVESLAAWLTAQGHQALPYHAGLADDVRSRHQEAFLDESVDIVVATVAFGMGIDRSNVRYVVHASAPRSLEHYQQESGRAGRDGLPAECVLIYSGADFLRWRRLLDSNGELTASAQALVRGMERYASGTGCRHKALLEYFGEPYDRGPCGACDWCLKELDPVADAAILAQKILSCVARVKQAWGIAHVTDILAGRATDKVVEAGHAALSTFALLRDEPPSAIRGYIEQLVEGGFLIREGDRYPVLRIAATGAALMRGQATCALYRQIQPARTHGRRKGREESVRGDGDLFEVLREVRRQLARDRGVPPYVIFHDTTLRDLVERRPATLAELYEVYGVGAKKAADFGQAFIDAIGAFLRRSAQ